MKHFLHIIILIALIAAMLYLDSYLRKEAEFMKEMVDIHAARLEHDLDAYHYRVEKKLINDWVTGKDLLLSDLKYLEQFKDTASPILSYSALQDSLKIYFELAPYQNIWPPIKKLKALKTKAYVRDWLEIALEYMPDTCIIAGEDDLELIVSQMKLKNDSIYFIAGIGYPIDSPYYDPLYGYKIDVTMLQTIPK